MSKVKLGIVFPVPLGTWGWGWHRDGVVGGRNTHLFVGFKQPSGSLYNGVANTIVYVWNCPEPC